jgi:hypothetical protein
MSIPLFAMQALSILPALVISLIAQVARQIWPGRQEPGLERLAKC